jgi:hypothetical protein
VSENGRLQLGDVFVLEGFESARAPAGRYYVCDMVPFDGDQPVQRVCLEAGNGRREWVAVSELANRKLHRRNTKGA